MYSWKLENKRRTHLSNFAIVVAGVERRHELIIGVLEASVIVVEAASVEGL